MAQNELLKKIRNIGIIALLVIASYVGVFTAGYITGQKSGYDSLTEQSDIVETRIEDSNRLSGEVIIGITGTEEGLQDIEHQITTIGEEVKDHIREVEYMSEINTDITARINRSEGYCNEFTRGIGSIDTGLSDIEGSIADMLRQD